MDKKDLIKALQEFKKKVQAKHAIKKIILFGSRANGKINKDSDVDLMIIGDFKGKSNLQRSPPFYDYWDIDLPVDFICYTPKEYNRLSKMVTIAREAKLRGVEI